MNSFIGRYCIFSLSLSLSLSFYLYIHKHTGHCFCTCVHLEVSTHTSKAHSPQGPFSSVTKVLGTGT